MDKFICNKCFAPIYRGQKPYNITQCGHIFCRKCLEQVKKQCFQCKNTNPAFLPLEEPIMPKKVSFVTPFAEILEILLNMEISQNNQLKITVERFHNIDNKYDISKKHYYLCRHNLKILIDKYTNLKIAKQNFEKELMQLLQSTPKSVYNATKTRINSDPISTYSLNTRYSSGSLNHLKFSTLNLSDATDESDTRFATNVKNIRKFKVDDKYACGDSRPPKTKLLFT